MTYKPSGGCHTEVATESKVLGLRFRKESRARAPVTRVCLAVPGEGRKSPNGPADGDTDAGGEMEGYEDADAVWGTRPCWTRSNGSRS